jgi:DNA-binding transcriptional MerR regulator
MGMEEPEVAPRGLPTVNPPTEQTYTKVSNSTEAPAEPVVETPVAEVPKETIAEPVKPEVEAPVAEATPATVEKVIEKIVEKYPEFKDENSKALFEHFTSGNTDGIFNYLSEIKKNYDIMSDIDVVKESLTKKNPLWTPQDVELELRAEYGKQLEKYNLDDYDKGVDPEGYKTAEAHNERADENLLRLQRAARDARVSLKEQQKTIELPKIQQETPQAAAPTAPTPEQIEKAQKDWAAAAEQQVTNLADYKFQVGDDKNPEEVVFAVTPEDKTARIDAMKKWNGGDFMTSRGWMNADGTFNLLKIAEDVHTLENVTKIAKSAYTQGVTKGKKDAIAKDIKNIDTEQNRATTVPGTPVNAGDLIWA